MSLNQRQLISTYLETKITSIYNLHFDYVPNFSFEHWKCIKEFDIRNIHSTANGNLLFLYSYHHKQIANSSMFRFSSSNFQHENGRDSEISSKMCIKVDDVIMVLR